MRKNSVKNSRINGEVQRVLAEVIRGEIKDPRIAPMTSVVDVEVAPDLKTCRAYISVLGSEEEAAATLEGLKSAEGFIRGRKGNQSAQYTRDSFYYGSVHCVWCQHVA